MCEPDPDVDRWGLHLLDFDQIFSSTYYGDNSQNDVTITHEQYTGDSHYDTDSYSVENDETIAHALQEEFQQLSVAEASDSSIVVQDWNNPSSQRNYYYGHDSGVGGADDAGHSSSCSSPENNSYEGEEYTYDLEITDEPMIDGEMGKRLTQLASIPHVPRINRDIPSIDEATSDHQRLLDRLQLYDLIERKIQGDGNCQFRALSDQFYRTPEHHKFVRQQVVNQLKSHPDLYEGYVPMPYGEYLKNMSKSGEWGDHVTLQAAADSYGIKIWVITSFKDTCYIEILPKTQKTERVIYLSFWAEVHYNSIYPQGELPPCDPKRKKKWWKFGHRH